MKKYLSILLTFVMLLGLVSTAAFAVETKETGNILLTAPVPGLGLIAPAPDDAGKITVTFDCLGVEENFTIAVDPGEVLHELPMVGEERLDQIFCGWYLDEACAKVFDITVPVTEPITLYAKWMAPMAFADVKEDHPLIDAIAYVYYNGIMNGVGDGRFDPEGSLTRAMLVTVLYRMEGSPAAKSAPFTDVAKGEWYADAVNWAYETGIVKGVSETEFAPMQNVSREQVATILYRYADGKGYDIDKLTADTNTLSADDIFDVSEYAAPGVHFCLATDILLEREEGKVMPLADATRAETAWALMSLHMLLPYYEAETPAYETLIGSYQDSFSQRASLDVAASGKDALQFTVFWANSAICYTEWKMTVRYDENGMLAYEDGVKKTIAFDKSGKASEAIDAENQKGCFMIENGAICWIGAPEENCIDCRFESIAEPSVGLPNPLVSMTAEELMEETGLSFTLPAGATDIRYFTIDRDMACVNFMLDGKEIEERILPIPVFAPISGCYYPWTAEEECTVGGRSGETRRYAGEEGCIEVCEWYDAAPGLMYSLTVSAKDLNGFDIHALAETLFTPVQGEV